MSNFILKKFLLDSSNIFHILEHSLQKVRKNVGQKESTASAIAEVASSLKELDKKLENDDRHRNIIRVISENVTKIGEKGVDEAMRLLIDTAKNRLRDGLTIDKVQEMFYFSYLLLVRLVRKRFEFIFMATIARSNLLKKKNEKICH